MSCMCRIDRLGLLIITGWFTYYEAKQPDFEDTGDILPIDYDYIDVSHRAHVLWNNGLVTQQREGEFRVRVPLPQP